MSNRAATKPQHATSVRTSSSDGTASRSILLPNERCRSVTFAGSVAEAEKVAWLQRAALLVRCSCRDCWGLTVSDAYACGAPVLAMHVPGLADSVQDGVTGLLVRQHRPEPLAAAMEKLLSDSEARWRMSRRALAWSANFDWEESASAVLAAAQRAVRRGPRSVVRVAGPTVLGRPVAGVPVAATGPGGSP